MEGWLAEIAHVVGLAIDLVAIVIIAIGSLEALWNILRTMISRHEAIERRAVWMQYARWLVAGLTFQLAADIVHTAIAPTWDDIGRLAAIAVIRTFLTFFLDRDMEKTRELQVAARESDAHALSARATH